jgi:aspartyl-tRNA(Asn)/glutamyl-tRNA(Gln) amidotransferase subunit A
MLRERKASSMELVEDSLRMIGKHNGELNAFLTVTEDLAREQAGEADRELAAGVDRGPLHGVPFALKDVFCTKGVRTTCGSMLFRDHVPDHDAAVTERLRAAGAVLIGKTGMHELAYGVTSNNPHFGAVRNPRNSECIPGGSSGGSGAAVGAGMVAMAMGSDTGGSIRIPAAFCGAVGLKPTFGRVSRYGVMPLDFSLDHMGPLASTVRDAAVTLAALAGVDARDDTSSPRPVGGYFPPEEARLDGLRIGLPENFYFDRVVPEVETAVRRMAAAAERLGAQVSTVRVPDVGAINTVGRVILMAEASARMGPYLDRREQFGADVRALLNQGRMLPATDYVNAQRLRRIYQRQFRQVFTRIDCLLTPTTPMGAPRIGQATVSLSGVEEDTRLAATRLVRAVNVLGLPAISIPCGLDGRGMPLGAQLIGRSFEEATLLRVAASLEGVE